MDALLKDLRYAMRILRKSPAFTLVAVLTLGLGIGANTAMFSVVNAVMLKPLPVSHPERLVWMRQSMRGEDWGPSCSGPDFLDWKKQSTVFQSMAIFRSAGLSLTGSGTPIFVRGGYVSEDFFETLNLVPVTGRFFTSDEIRSDKPLVVISSSLWQEHFGGDKNIIGRSVNLGDGVYSIVGVAPSGMDYPFRFEIWLPFSMHDPYAQNRDTHNLVAFGRLKPGVTLQQAQTEINIITKRLQTAYPATNTNRGVLLTQFTEQAVRYVRPALFVLLATVGFVLLIACVNIANLQMARASARRREMAVRFALGARRSDVMRQLMTESVLLAIVGAVVGILFARWGMSALLALVPAGYLPSYTHVQLDRTVMAFTMALALLTGLLFGLAPALQSSHADPNEDLKQASATAGTAGTGFRLRNVLVIVEFAATFLLLVGSGLTLKAFSRLLHVEPGCDPHNVLTMHLPLPAMRASEVATRLNEQEEMLRRIRSLPGVLSATAASFLPAAGGNISSDFLIEGRPAPPPPERPQASTLFVGSDYFRTLSVAILRGRAFSSSDDVKATRVAVINRSMAEKFWPHEDPVGKRIAFETVHGGWTWWQIIGVAADVHNIALDVDVRWDVYFPMEQASPEDMAYLSSTLPLFFAVKTTGDPSSFAKPVEKVIHAVNGNQVVRSFTTMDEIMARGTAGPKFNSWLLALFAALGLVMSAAGIYSLLSWVVTQRTREIGIRMALGGSYGDMMRLVLRQGMRLVVAGLLIGAGLSLALTRLMEDLLFSIKAIDPVVLAIMAIVLIVIAGLASYVPARRATRVDPMVALRYE